MSELKTLAAAQRTGLGKGCNRRLREKQLVPGVYYAGNGENIAVQLPMIPLTKMYASVGRTTVFNLDIEGKGTFPVLVWDAQRDPCKGFFTHVDFYGVDLHKPVKITVPLEFTGVARGTKVGGALENYREKVVLIAKPLEMPAKVVVDITNLDLGKTIYVADLVLPEGVVASYDVNYAIVSVITPGGADEAAE